MRRGGGNQTGHGKLSAHDADLKPVKERGYEVVEERSTDWGFRAITNRITKMRMGEIRCLFQKARPTPPILLGIYHNIPTRCVRKGKPVGQNLYQDC